MIPYKVLSHRVLPLESRLPNGELAPLNFVEHVAEWMTSLGDVFSMVSNRLELPTLGG